MLIPFRKYCLGKNALYRRIYKIFFKMDHIKWSLCGNINKEQILIFEIWLYIENRSSETGRLSKGSGKQNKTKQNPNETKKQTKKLTQNQTIRLKKMLSIERRSIEYEECCLCCQILGCTCKHFLLWSLLIFTFPFPTTHFMLLFTSANNIASRFFYLYHEGSDPFFRVNIMFY